MLQRPPQFPLSQNGVPFSTGRGHTMPHAPQLFGSYWRADSHPFAAIVSQFA